VEPMIVSATGEKETRTLLTRTGLEEAEISLRRLAYVNGNWVANVADVVARTAMFENLTRDLRMRGTVFLRDV